MSETTAEYKTKMDFDEALRRTAEELSGPGFEITVKTEEVGAEEYICFQIKSLHDVSPKEVARRIIEKLCEFYPKANKLHNRLPIHFEGSISLDILKETMKDHLL